MVGACVALSWEAWIERLVVVEVGMGAPLLVCGRWWSSVVIVSLSGDQWPLVVLIGDGRRWWTLVVVEVSGGRQWWSSVVDGWWWTSVVAVSGRQSGG